MSQVDVGKGWQCYIDSIPYVDNPVKKGVSGGERKGE